MRKPWKKRVRLKVVIDVFENFGEIAYGVSFRGVPDERMADAGEAFRAEIHRLMDMAPELMEAVNERHNYQRGDSNGQRSDRRGLKAVN